MTRTPTRLNSKASATSRTPASLSKFATEPLPLGGAFAVAFGVHYFTRFATWLDVCAESSGTVMRCRATGPRVIDPMSGSLASHEWSMAGI